MELVAAIEALKALDKKASADLYTDSRYLIDGITKWINSWQRNNWRTYEKKPVINQDLWRQLLEHVQNREINWIWTKGHSSDRYNEFVDILAKITIPEREGVDVRTSVDELNTLTLLPISDLGELLWRGKLNQADA
jgi:ribonuclease HI